MNFIELKKVTSFEQNKRLSKRYATFEKLILELAEKEIPPEIVKSVNQEIETINAFSEPNKDLSKQLRKSTMRHSQNARKKTKASS